MKLNFKLDFFYYQIKLYLDETEDPKELELFKEEKKFENFLNTEELSQVIGLMVMVYKYKYADPYVWDAYLGNKQINYERFPAPFELTKLDLFMVGKQMTRDDIEYILTSCTEYIDEKDTEYIYMKKIEIAFKEAPIGIAEAIETELEDLNYSVSTKDGTKIYTVQDSPIAELHLNSDKFVLVANSDKWEGWF